jgi:hypothetical protein
MTAALRIRAALKGAGAAVKDAAAGGVAMAGAAASGVAMLALPALTAPALAQVITAAGLLAVAASLAGRSSPAATLAAAAAIAQCVIAQPATALIAADGLLITGFMLLADAPRHAAPPAARRWLRAQVPGIIAAVLVTGTVLAAITLPAASSAWIALAGIAAAVAAYLIAIPRQPRPPG